MILTKYILRNLAVPFLFSMFTLTMVFILNFLMKFAERLVGKGLDTWVIVKLISFNLAWMVVLVVPMSVLISSLMAFGAMSQNNEITIMKASGINLYKIIRAPFLASIIISILLVMFNNDVLPEANHRAKLLLQDISDKKPTLSLVPGVFSKEVNNYAIRVTDINQQSNDLYGITIYDYSNRPQTNVITADSGRLFFSANQANLVMDLHHGEIHEEQRGKQGEYRILKFSRQRITMDAQNFAFQQTNPTGGNRGDRELSAQDMLHKVDSLSARTPDYQEQYAMQIERFFYEDTLLTGSTETAAASTQMIYARAVNRVKNARNMIVSAAQRLDRNEEEIRRYMVEVHKKYSIPFACLVFVLIGAPLGVMTRKGGFGVAGPISLIFYIIYWASLIAGEKLADRGFISPFLGMWMANIIIGGAGIWLLVRSVKSTILIDFSGLGRLIPKSWRNAGENRNDDS